MKLVLIRHGESEANVLQSQNSFFYCGRWDCELTEKGRMQAKLLKGNAVLDGAKKIISSPLKRAVDTATGFTDREITVDARLTERSLGDFNGKFRGDLEKIPEYKKYFTERRLLPFRSSFSVCAPNGETYADVVKRVTSFLEELKTLDLEKVIIVSHAVAIRCMLKIINGLSEEETLALFIDNCDPVAVEYR